MDSIKNKSAILINLVIAVAFGIYIPLRVVLLENNYYLDQYMDGIGLIFLLSSSYLNFINKNKFQFQIYTIIIGLPILSLVSFYFPDINSSGFLILKLLSLRELGRINKIIYEMDGLHPVIARIAPLTIMVPILVHLLACGWIFLEAVHSQEDGDKLFIYGRAVYWSITTLCTVGYGDIVAKTLPQMAYANIVMIIGVAFFGYVLSNVASLLSRLDGAREAYMTNLDRVETYMRYNNIPTDLRLKVREYLRYVWESRKGYDDEEALAQLPKGLRGDLSFFMNHSVIGKVPILKGASNEMVRDIVINLKPLVCTPGESIFKVGDVGGSMFFIQKGQVQIVSGTGEVLVTLNAGSFFGEMALLTSSPRNASAVSVNYSDLFVLSQEDFAKTLSSYPEFEEQVKKIAIQRSA